MKLKLAILIVGSVFVETIAFQIGQFSNQGKHSVGKNWEYSRLHLSLPNVDNDFLPHSDITSEQLPLGQTKVGDSELVIESAVEAATELHVEEIDSSTVANLESPQLSVEVLQIPDIIVDNIEVKSVEGVVASSGAAQPTAVRLQAPIKSSVDQVVAPATTSSNPDDLFMLCTACKVAYRVDLKDFSMKGERVRCNICDKEWFQTQDRMMKLDSLQKLQKMTDEKAESIKTMVKGGEWPRYPPRPERFDVFVGNLPFNFDEQQLGKIDDNSCVNCIDDFGSFFRPADLFGEYGLVSVALIKGPDQVHKGYAFLEVSHQHFWVLADHCYVSMEIHNIVVDGSLEAKRTRS